MKGKSRRRVVRFRVGDCHRCSEDTRKKTQGDDSEETHIELYCERVESLVNFEE
jgi:hypothetical protein